MAAFLGCERLMERPRNGPAAFDLLETRAPYDTAVQGL